MTNAGPLDSSASAAATGIAAAASGSPMTTASKVSSWAHCCTMATGICQVDLSTQASFVHYVMIVIYDNLK